MATYPAGITTLASVAALESSTPTHSTHHNTMKDEIVALETTVGTNPQGAFASVAARIAAREPTITTYTPTLGGTGWAIGNGTASGRYISVDGFVRFIATITFGGTSTFGASANATVSLPVNAHSVESGSRHITVTLTDTSVPTFFRGVAQVGGTLSGVNILATNVAGSNVVDVSTSSTVPFTWATTDVIQVAGTYIIS